jgi:hypothetical protein
LILKPDSVKSETTGCEPLNDSNPAPGQCRFYLSFSTLLLKA